MREVPGVARNDDDASARERALDVSRSFLVQAPAGSGKTGLLIQRFLALLAGVDRPERIVAMTFTRKAAGEMRERVIDALRAAQAQTPVDSPQAQRTRALALAVLAQDRRHDWQLDAHPARLAVFTIDALAAGLARQAPLATRMGAAPRYEERATPLYARAARAALAAATPDDPAWQRLLAHLDNDAGSAIELVADMLGKRDQWLPELVRDERGAFRAALEATLAAEVAGELATVHAAFPEALRAALPALQRYAAGHLTDSPAHAEFAAHLVACAEGGGLPPPAVVAQQPWRTLARWLLVADAPRFRARVNKNDGFPAKGTGDGAAGRQHHNEAMTALLADLAAVPDLAEALHAVRCLPPPHYADDAWAIVDAMLTILPQAAGFLTLAFRDADTIDFTQGTLAALAALGAEDAPSDLLLKLDYQLQHLLVDEFQDTSFTQLALIRRLTAGWQHGDGRTLFAVGDPMQSIYRFRGAEVRLFVEAQDNGHVGTVPVENIVLRRSYRSQAALVGWINATFPDVLGSRNDPWRGKVGFAPSVAMRAALDGPAATLEVFPDANSEARAVVGRVRAALTEGAESVAVLVRARAHLGTILPELRAAGIAYSAVELDALSERQAVLDLASLAHALTQPADRHAWLASLRAPWCGLALPDLFAVVDAAQFRHRGAIAGLVEDASAVTGLSKDGTARFARAAAVLRPALAARGRASLSARVRGAWLALGGPATLDEPLDLDAAERFFALLAAHEKAGDVPDWASFVAALAELRAAPDVTEVPDAPRLQVMTLHKAKGLEFDTVVLPGLARVPRRGDTEVLRWRRRQRGLMLAPMKARGGSEDPIFAYLRWLAASEESAELARLLYVGCTRARHRLHLTGVLGIDATGEEPPAWAPPPAGSALARICAARGIADCPPPAAAPAYPGVAPRRLLARLPLAWDTPVPERSVPAGPAATPAREALPFDWAREAARHSGTVAHRLFAQIGREGLGAWNAVRVAALAPRIRAELVAEGVDDAEVPGAAAAVALALERLLDDTRGRWLFDPGNTEARSEWALAAVESNAIVHVVVDRSFVADGTRWIVDFKTGTHEGADVEAFLDREVERYREQLARYARVVRGLDPRPIRLALYYPLLSGWREWPYTG